MDRFQGIVDLPIDGWELIRRDLGYDDAGNPAKTTNPTLILYNRYTGMLRVFVAVGDLLSSYQFAEIKLYFGRTATYKAGTLNRQSALGVALEDTEPSINPGFIAIARYLNGRSKWFVADFPMDYDPCICQFDSRLVVDVSLISQADVKLIGKTTGTLITTAANGGTGTEMDKGIPFIRKVNSTLEAGGKTYDNIDKFTNNLAGENPNKAGALGLFGAELKKGGFLRTGLSALPWIGEAVSLLDFFMGGGKDAGPQPVSLQPMAIDMSTTTTGTITAASLYTTVPFHNPGNRISVSLPENIPFYNEAMGVFSLLRRPTVQTAFSQTLLADRTSRLDFKYRLAEDLSYVINPASGLEVQDFQVALVSEAISPNSYAPSGFTFTESPVVQPTPDANGNPIYNNAYRTGYFDAACIKNRTFTITTSSSPSAANYYRTKSLTLKVILNLRPIGGSSTRQNVLFVARYPVNTVSLGETLPIIPTATCGVLPQADLASIRAVCDGTKYKTAIVLARPSHSDVATTAGIRKQDANQLQAFPNPATGSVRLSYQVLQPGRARLTLSDGLGRLVRTVLDQEQATVGTFETSAGLGGLQAGVYYCTLHTASQHIVKKIVIND